MVLTDAEISELRPSDKPYMVEFEHGIYLLITPKGNKIWKEKIINKDGTESFSYSGRYPSLSFANVISRKKILEEMFIKKKQERNNNLKIPEAIDISARIIDRIYPILQRIILEELNNERINGTNHLRQLDAQKS